MRIKICLLTFLSLLLIATAAFCEEEAAPAPEVSSPEVGSAEFSSPEVSNPEMSSATASNAKVLFGFEENVPSWEIPDWCFEKEEYVGESVAISTKFAKEGKSSLEVMTNFPGKKWTATYIEVQQFFDWTPYKTLSVDVYLPKEAPFGLQARLILTVGNDWTWTEMARLVKLVPGEWTTVSASLVPGSTDWRRTQVTDAFRSDVRKFGIRIESNMKPAYSGPIYIDSVRLE